MKLRAQAIVMTALLAAGCQSVSQAGVDMVRVAPTSKMNVFMGHPSIGKVIPKSGMGQLNFHLKIKGATPADVTPLTGHYGILALPDGAGGTALDPDGAGPLTDFNGSVFTEAMVQLYSGSANGTFNAVRHVQTFARAAFTTTPDGAGYYTAAGTFGPLRPANDYTSQIFLKNQAGTISTKRLGASAANTGVTINAGPNNVDFTCTVNGSEASYALTGSNYGNTFNDGGLVKGDTITINTGIADNQPGVARVETQIVGITAAYPGPTKIIRYNTTPGTFSTVTWDTNVSGLAINNEDYVAGNLTPGADGTFTGNAGQLDFVAFNAQNQEVGRASMAILVFGTPTTTIRIK